MADEQKVNLREAADHASNLAKQYRSVLLISEALGTVGNLEERIEVLTRRDKELTDKCNSTQAELTALQQQVVEENKNIEKAKYEAADILHNAQAELQKVKDDITLASNEYNRIKKIIEDMKAKF